MRKTFIAIALCIGAALGAPANAQQFRSQLMTAPEMVGAAHAVKNSQTQPLLEQWVRACLKKEWGNCQVAWWNLTEKGGLVQIEKDGYSSWGFLNQPDANEVLMHMVTGLDNPLYRPAWDIEITSTKQYPNLPNIVDGRNALTDGTDQRIAMAIVAERLASRKVVYEVKHEMPTTRMEWLRLVALMYAVRDDASSSYQVLTELQKHVKLNAEATEQYNQTLKAVQTYIQQGKSK